MKNNYFSRCVLLAGLCSVIMVFAVTPVYATGGAFSPLPHAVSEGDITVTGKVVDDAGEPLIGVSIQVKGTSKGATTDVNGIYTLNIASGSTLVFSYIGMKTIQRKVTKGGKLDITMENDENMLDEVVAVGYGSMKRSDLTGSVVSINAKSIEESMASTIDQALQGRAAGLQMTQNSGVPGGGTSIQIRGVNSLNSTNEPIYVVDGVIISGETGSNTSNAMAGINPADIESIEILKDASATAIYGAQAANGVILITMKAGVTGKPRINFQASVGNQEIPKTIDMMNLRDYARHYNELYTLINASRVKDAFSHPETLGDGTNWQDEIFRNALLQNYNLSIRGGTKTVSYNLSGGYLGQDGICIGSDFERYTFRMGTEIQVTPKVRFGGTVNVSYTKQGTGMASWSIIPNALYQAPDVPVRDKNGNFSGPEEDDQQNLSNYSNPVALAALTQRNNEKGGARANLFMKINPWKWLTYRTDFTADGNIDNYQYFLPQYELGYSKNPYPTNEHSKNYGLYWGWKNVVTMEKTFKRKHKTSLMLGHEMTSRSSDYLQGKRTHGDNLLTDLDAGDAAYATNSGRASKTTYLSYFSRLFYSYDNRYQLTATVRRDGTSRFAKGNRWGIFPSFSAGWRLSEEEFMKDIPWIYNLKLRASWGQLGNERIDLFRYVDLMNLKVIKNDGSITDYNYPLNGAMQSGAAITAYNDPNITWETTTMTNVGIDASLLNGNLDFSFEFFDKRTSDILRKVTLPDQVGGLDGPIRNIGEVSNKGFELNMGYRNNIGDFRYEVNGNMTFIKNKIVSLKGQTIIDGMFILEEGKPIDSYYMLHAIGIFQSEEEIKNSPYQTAATKPGYLKFEDTNGDGKITEDDRQIRGGVIPKITYGFNINLGYKDWDLSAFFQGVTDVYTYGDRIGATPLWFGCGLPEQWLTDAWTPERGTSATLPILTTYEGCLNENFRTNDFWLRNASYLRLKNLQLSYNVPVSFLKSGVVKRLKVFVNAQNLFTFSPMKDFDPEKNLKGSNWYAYPSVRTYTAGVNVTF